MLTGKTKTGFAYAVSERATSSWGFVAAMAALSRKDGDETEKLAASIDVVNATLGREQANRLVQHVQERSEDGIATMDEVYAEMREIFDALRNGEETKN